MKILIFRLVILRIDIKNVTFLHLILDYQFQNLLSRLSIIKISDLKCDIKIIVNFILITEISRFQTYLSFFIINICDFKIFKNK